jgi:hypothetical protein
VSETAVGSAHLAGTMRFARYLRLSASSSRSKASGL